MPEWTCSIRSSPVPAGGSARSAPRLRLRYLRVGGSLATGRPLPRPVVDRFDLHTAFLGHAPLGGQVLQRVDRGAHHVVRVGRAQALRENIPHARALQHRAHRAARERPRPGPPARPPPPRPPPHPPPPPPRPPPPPPPPRGRPCTAASPPACAVSVSSPMPGVPAAGTAGGGEGGTSRS